MIKIIKINICRFRSIIDLTVDIEQEYGLISICGKNNVGKTNTLRALSLFFNENDYAGFKKCNGWSSNTS